MTKEFNVIIERDSEGYYITGKRLIAVFKRLDLELLESDAAIIS